MQHMVKSRFEEMLVAENVRPRRKRSGLPARFAESNTRANDGDSIFLASLTYASCMLY